MQCQECGSTFNHIDSAICLCGNCRTIETDAERLERLRAEARNPRLKLLRKKSV